MKKLKLFATFLALNFGLSFCCSAFHYDYSSLAAKGTLSRTTKKHKKIKKAVYPECRLKLNLKFEEKGTKSARAFYAFYIVDALFDIMKNDKKNVYLQRFLRENPNFEKSFLLNIDGGDSLYLPSCDGVYIDNFRAPFKVVEYIEKYIRSNKFIRKINSNISKEDFERTREKIKSIVIDLIVNEGFEIKKLKREDPIKLQKKCLVDAIKNFTKAIKDDKKGKYINEYKKNIEKFKEDLKDKAKLKKEGRLYIFNNLQDKRHFIENYLFQIKDIMDVKYKDVLKARSGAKFSFKDPYKISVFLKNKNGKTDVYEIDKKGVKKQDDDKWWLSMVYGLPKKPATTDGVVLTLAYLCFENIIVNDIKSKYGVDVTKFINYRDLLPIKLEKKGIMGSYHCLFIERFLRDEDGNITDEIKKPVFDKIYKYSTSKFLSKVYASSLVEASKDDFDQIYHNAVKNLELTIKNKKSKDEKFFKDKFNNIDVLKEEYIYKYKRCDEYEESFAEFLNAEKKEAAKKLKYFDDFNRVLQNNKDSDSYKDAVLQILKSIVPDND